MPKVHAIPQWCFQLLPWRNQQILTRCLSTFDWDQLAKIRQHGRKERLKNSNVAKFESDVLITNEDISPQRSGILQTFVWWGTCSCPPPLNKRRKTFATLWSNIFARFWRITFKLGKLPYFKAPFPTVSMDIRLLLLTAYSLVEKKPRKDLLSILTYTVKAWDKNKFLRPLTCWIRW